jgi:sterol desaturase/sphingolipid hydroxylase (fatty acid hydroxylase superfamily)
MKLALPTLFIIISTCVFLFLERLFPGRELPPSRGWYIRVWAINLCQLGITLLTNRVWIKLLGGYSLFHLEELQHPLAEGFIAWITGTFFFYWWHRLRHVNGFWQVFHQLHHSPKRIETLTSFYKHPIEILADSALSGVIIYVLLGASLEGAFWFNFFAATGEYFYHSNLKSPKWLKYIIQTPELHSIHHELDVHKYNYSDLPLWDRLFGTYKDTDTFSAQCGFPNDNERKVWKMLLFKDVYNDKPK